MKIFYAGGESPAYSRLLSGEGVPRLLSYYYIQNSDFTRWSEAKYESIFIDSGAFTAWTKGQKIDVDKYIDFLNKHDKHLSLFGQIDKIPGVIDSTPTHEQVDTAAEETWNNYLYMRERVKSPHKLLYTFHVGEDINYLKRALEWTDDEGNHIPYIAFGGMVGKSTPIRTSFIRNCFSAINESSNPKVKVHAFGMTSTKLLEQFPFESADSTSWVMTAANGNILTKYGTLTVSSADDRKIGNSNDIKTYTDHELAVLEEYIKMFNITLEDLSSDYYKRALFNIRYLQKYIEEFKPRYIHKQNKPLF